MTIKCIVACTNSGGESDLFFVKVKCLQAQVDVDLHAKAAKCEAAKNGYIGPFVVFDEFDDAGNAMLPLFAWATASRVHV